MFGGSRRIELNRSAFALSNRVCVFLSCCLDSVQHPRPALLCACLRLRALLDPYLVCHVVSSHLIRCIDYSDTQRPVLWIISEHAWYKVAGSGWWDFVAPHPTYAPFFEPSRKVFALACLVARALQSR